MIEKWNGQRLTDDLKEEIRAATEKDRVRVWRPETISTMDLRMDRVNIYVDAEDVIQKVRVG